MKNDQTSKVDMGSFTWITGMAITFVLFAYFGWNFFVTAALSALVSELYIKSALTRKTANDGNVPKLIAIANRGWWLIVCLITVPVLCILMSAPGRRLSGGDYIWGELIIVIALARAGWIDLNYDRKLRAVMLFLSCIGWILLAIPGNEIATAIILFVTLGLTAIAFLWSFADSLSDNPVRGDPDGPFGETSKNDQWHENDLSGGQINGRQFPVTDNCDRRNQENEEGEARVLNSNKTSGKQHARGKIGNDKSAFRTMDSSLNLQRKSTLRTDLIVICPKCKTRVLPKADGTCPSCQAKISK